jgi:actin related protein 2/3 complex subunit 5
MAKNTESNAFRTVDVDQYNEDNYKEEEVVEPTTLGPNEADINNLLAQNKNIDALKNVLSNAPLGSKDPAAKQASLALALRVLLAIKASQIDEAVGQLDSEARDILMKFIYRGFETPSENSSAHLLIWHEKVFAVSGVGSIVRVLTDKKKV